MDSGHAAKHEAGLCIGALGIDFNPEECMSDSSEAVARSKMNPRNKTADCLIYKITGHFLSLQMSRCCVTLSKCMFVLPQTPDVGRLLTLGARFERFSDGLFEKTQSPGLRYVTTGKIDVHTKSH